MKMTALFSKGSPTQKQFLALALPNMLAGMAVPIAELVDLAFLGHLDDVTPLAGVVLATVIFDYIFWCFGFLRMGTTGLVAQAVGRDDKAEQEALFWRAVLLGFTLGALLTLLQSPIAAASFSLLSGGSAVESAGLAYFGGHIWGAIPTLINYAIIGWFLGRGKSNYVLIMTLNWQLINIGLNYVFIIEWGWGAAGAGYAIAIAEWVTVILAFALVIRHWGRLPHFNKMRVLQWSQAKALMILNASIMGRTLLLMTVLASFTNISATFGEVTLAANALMMKLFIFFAFIVDGFAIALETFAGTALGRKDNSQLKRSFNMAMSWTMVSAALLIIVYLISAESILGLITEHAEVIAAALPYKGWMFASIAIGGIAFIYDGLFYGLARPKQLFISMLWASIGYVPLAYVAWSNQSTHQLWFALVAFTIIRALTMWRPVKRALNFSDER